MGNLVNRDGALLVVALGSGLALGAMAERAYDIVLIMTWLTGS
jgi:hypothetical protein